MEEVAEEFGKLDMLAIEGAIVTIGAMGGAGQRFRQAPLGGMARGGCQREIAAKIMDRKADSILARNRHQSSLREANGNADAAISLHEIAGGGHGRIETRTTAVLRDATWPRERQGLAGSGRVLLGGRPRGLSAPK